VRLHLELFNPYCLFCAQLAKMVLCALELVFCDCQLSLEELVPVLQCPNAFRFCRLNTAIYRI
jgi:hypothetical protein